MSQVDSVSPVQEVRGQRAPKTGFRPDIEGLRAVAVLAVVLFHAGVPGVGGGFIGVDVFFVISGFLITGMLWREVSTTGGVRLGRFYGARARRLLPASATVGVVTAIGSAILLSPLEVRDVLKDGIACALYVGNYRFAQQGIDYFGLGSAALTVSALLVIRRRRAVLPDMAAVDHRRGVADPACPAAHRQQPRRHLDDSLPGGAGAGGGGLVHRVGDHHPHGGSGGVFFAAHPGLAVGRRRPDRPDRHPVAPTPAPRRRDHRLGRAGRNPGGLHPIRRHHTLSGYCGAVAGAGRRTGDRGRLCHPYSGLRARAGNPADARDRAGVVFVVSVALAGAAAGPGRCWATRWGWPKGWQRPPCRPGWPCSPCA